MNLLGSWMAADVGHRQLKLVCRGHEVWDLEIPPLSDTEEEGPRLAAVLNWGFRQGWNWSWFLRRMSGRLVVVYPPGTDDEILQKWQHDLSSLGVARLEMVDASLAAAAGSGEQVGELACRGVLSMGAICSWFAVYALGELVACCELPFGGWNFDVAIQSFIKSRDRIDISELKAEGLRSQLGRLQFGTKRSELLLQGRESSGTEKTTILYDTELCELLQDCLEPLLWSIRVVMRKIPPEMLVDLSRNPLCLVGGLARMTGMAEFLEKQLHLPVKVPSNPEHAVVLGALKLAAERRFWRPISN